MAERRWKSFLLTFWRGPDFVPAAERMRLWITDIEILRLHYAETLRNWRERFLAHREDVERVYDRRFVRMWEFYLAASEQSFRQQAMMNFQIQNLVL